MDFSDRAPLSLDRDRVTCLLLINTHLIKKCCNIYNTMLNNQQLMQQMTPENRAMLSNVYNNYIRRLQCNLATLNYLYEKYHSTQHLPVAAKASFPMILSAPPDMPELNQLYSKLQELYPEAVQYFKIKFEESRKQQAFLAPQQNQPPPQQHSLHQQLPPQPQPQSQPSLQQQQGLQLLLMFRLNLCNNKVSANYLRVQNQVLKLYLKELHHHSNNNRRQYHHSSNSNNNFNSSFNNNSSRNSLNNFNNLNSLSNHNLLTTCF